MATDFIGYTILVTLQNPPQAQIQGIVSDVANQKLYLRDVSLLWNGQRLSTYVLDAGLIADLEVAPSSTSSLPTPTLPSQNAKKPRPAEFQDPAILSYNKPFHQPVSPIMIADGIVPSPVSPPRGIAKQSSISSIATSQYKTRRDSEATAILTEPFDALALGVAVKVKKHRSTPSQTAPGIIDVKDMHKAKEKKAGKGKGWRSTPLLEPPTRRRGRKIEENGWATEDATDIQDMPEFDFESNLSKFNKRQVFDDIRKDDNIPQDERLVSFNRRPGTNGGKNLHFTENVLEEVWKSEAGETEEEQPDHYSSGRGSRRANSRKPLASRKASLLPVERTASPRPLSRVATALNGSVNGIKASFRLPNNKPCNCVSPLQMLEIEQLCTSDLGLSDDILSENAGRSIAEAVLKTTPEPKSVVFLVGNHKSGARSVVAARHLRNRRLRVTVILLGGEREDSILESVKRQFNIYKKGGGWVEKWDEYQSKLAAGAPKPDVVVDALLGMHVAFDELRTDDQAVVFEMTKWAERMGNVVSIDVPSGVSASSGLITEAEEQVLVMPAKKVVCLAAPKVGLLQAMSGVAEEGGQVGWEVVVADIGVSASAWQRHGSRRRQGVEFASEWVVNVRFVTS